LVEELGLYDPALLKKPRLVAANKMDVPAAKKNLTAFKRRHRVPVLPISCLEETGLAELRAELLRRVRKLRPREKVSPSA
jgi:GTPase